ncbi:MULTISPECIES: helix-hairpin-helix domain-containing protein [unclassified Streptococcus]|uniref:helix-hairpin-helix domain-containing protein n=1 Tax=unclassified Streptococcus TaxID=2608887 RepID=UPI001072D0E6|nr:MULTISPECIES: helix-hairpin-helix domain-containing protein [unclassified Streptococcus]MBF0786757.1 helix-hairpin-helix domain-containing protein [Streptococcus sp. 19428wC2_LYSM12]MCQ9210994.1 helix-hairpin-helix domain-containing protein [Streptococcus sp. B01]MCQ9214267.1 helix-hairpin-helix domain-containing protein [Streptococcus sp. O1]TFV06301.1 ComEA family DNA-binding protein [Streptococcus sp. LYSM12]
MSEKWIPFLRHYQLLVVVAVGGLVMTVTFFLIAPIRPSGELGRVEELVSSSEQVMEMPISKQSIESLMVDVKGAVKKPGIYHLSVGSRVHDAVEAAGGLTEAADSKSINLAQKLSDEGVIYVATKEEAISVVPTTRTAQTSSDKGVKEGLVNLNTATEADLQTIAGIGTKRATDIIAYRESKGHFQSVDDLKDVPGIGSKSLENIRPYVTVD